MSPRNGDVLHGLAKAYIASVADALFVDDESLQGWKDAEDVWMEAIEVCPSHQEIALKKARLESYYPFPLRASGPLSEWSGAVSSSPNKGKKRRVGKGKAAMPCPPERDDFEAYALSMGRWAFCTRTPVLDPGQCEAIVAEAEVFAIVLCLAVSGDRPKTLDQALSRPCLLQRLNLMGGK